MTTTYFPKHDEHEAMQAVPRDMTQSNYAREQKQWLTVNWLGTKGITVIASSVDTIVFEYQGEQYGTEPGDWIIWRAKDGRLQVLSEVAFYDMYAVYIPPPLDIVQTEGGDVSELSDAHGITLATKPTIGDVLPEHQKPSVQPSPEKGPHVNPNPGKVYKGNNR